ncbi:hypothetical protein K7X08_021551 [Anisodus acutangulus]|uniref:carbamoyl-phosphate synthase (glutamine-hydrolyzing) n=1 Tax=Anisodus acutangulus TaxID=402998 RepID=A0A9Q1M7J4_9SOLA|nr:hypothetical protein K7X08_021551 [Anisodus acutangulus]
MVFIVYCIFLSTSNWRCKETLGDYLAERNIMGIYDVDTRAITRRLREDGSLIGVLSTENSKSDKEFLEMSRTWDIVASAWDFEDNGRNKDTFNVVAYDFGIKQNILRRLASYGCKITVVPSTWPASETLKMRPDEVLFSNGQGNPSAVPYAVELNHNYAVDPESLPEGVEVTHVNLNDGSCAGLASFKMKLMSLQCHPEASPEPHDSYPVFGEFIQLMKQEKVKA